MSEPVVALIGGRRPRAGVRRIPIDELRDVVGTLLLIFGLQWLRKAILRSSGFKALHDEDAIFRAEVAAPRRHQSADLDWYTFTVSFKGVFLEGLEVAFIVVTFGGAQVARMAAVGAAAALVVGSLPARRPPPARSRAGEHDEVRGRLMFTNLRHLLGGQRAASHGRGATRQSSACSPSCS